MFTQPVSMPSTPEQYSADLRNELIKLGYDASIEMYTNDRYIEAYKGKAFGRITKATDTFHIDQYNPELFLAIAAMSDKDMGVVGEWWYAHDSGEDITKGKIYKCVENELNTIVILDDAYDHQEIDKEYTRKATLQEILEHFNYNNQKEMEQDNPNILQLTPDELRQLLKAIETDNKIVFKATMLERFLSEGSFYIYKSEFEHYFLKLLKALK